MAKFPASPRIGQAFLDGNTLYVWSGNQWIYINDFKVTGDLMVDGNLTVGVGSDLTGGNINLYQDTSGGLSGSNVKIDIYSSKIRIFEDGGDYRGVNIDISKAPAGSDGEIAWKASGITSAGYKISLGDIGVQLSTSGNRSFQISTTGPNITSMSSGWTAYASTTTTQYSGQSTTITGTMTYIRSAFNFSSAGDTVVHHITDSTNGRLFRITGILGASFNNNYICIERLH